MFAGKEKILHEFEQDTMNLIKQGRTAKFLAAHTYTSFYRYLDRDKHLALENFFWISLSLLTKKQDGVPVKELADFVYEFAAINSREERKSNNQLEIFYRFYRDAVRFLYGLEVSADSLSLFIQACDNVFRSKATKQPPFNSILKNNQNIDNNRTDYRLCSGR